MKTTKSTKTFIISIICLLIVSVNQIHSQSTKLDKLNSIIQLTKFIDWSENTDFSRKQKKLYIISGYNSPLNYEIQSKKDINYKNWQIICRDRLNSVTDGSVVYLTKEKKSYADELIKLSDDKDILTIAENQDNFCNKGGMINLIEEHDVVNFEINYKIIRNKSLNISSKILALAKIYD